MRGWALSTAIVLDTPYWENVRPLTFPRMESYAALHEMDFIPTVVIEGALDGFPSPAPRGTAANYINLPNVSHLLREYDGVVFLDADVLIIHEEEDICQEVDAIQPIGSVGGLGLLVMQSGELSRAFIDTIWAMRARYGSYQWLEQAAALHMLGYDPNYPGDGLPPVRVTMDTPWTPYVKELDVKWNWHPHRDKPPCYFWHATGVQPFEERLRMMRQASELPIF